MNGDKIIVLEVQGTSDTLSADNIYMIKGNYTLASHPRATLAAYVTAMDAQNGIGVSHHFQTTVVNRGSGSFTLFLPMTYRGWPHLSFYPAEGGSDFGGSYFGTGESVLKQWWGSRKADREPSGAISGSSEAARPPAPKPPVPTFAELPYAVPFEQGASRLLNGDKISILEIRGTSRTFMPDNTYMIKGTYTLATHQRATLAASITAMDAAHWVGAWDEHQTAVVNQGTGTFTLVLPMTCHGWPHLSFYPAEGGSDFGGSYFGTGDFVLKHWWGSKKTE